MRRFLIVPVWLFVTTAAFSQIQMCDQSPGTDAGAKINACIGALPSTGGIADARNIQGVQTSASTININKPIQLLLGNISLTFIPDLYHPDDPGINCNFLGASIIGLGPNQGTGTTLITSSATGDIYQANQPFCSVSNLLMRSSVLRSGGAALDLRTGGGTFDHLRIERTYNGIAMQCAGCSGSFDHIQMGTGSSTSGNWNAGIIAGGFSSGTVASAHFSDVTISGESPFADSMIDLDSGVDTFLFSNVEAVQGGADSIVLKLQKTGAATPPRWIRFTNSSFEAGITENAIEVITVLDIRFTNCYIATSKIGIHLNGSSINGFVWENGSILNIQQSGILVDSASNFDILNSRIADVSQQSSGFYPSINIAPGTSNFTITGNYFASLIGRGLPNYNIAVEAGTSNKYIIINNRFATYSVSGLLDLGTGASKNTTGNLP